MATVTDTGTHTRSSAIQNFARFAGIAFIAIALVGFLTTGTSMDANPETAPRLFGLFPVNVAHNAVHLLLGIWALAASRTSHGARSYAKAAGGLYLGLALLGVVAPDGFGLTPLGSHDIWLHLVLGAGLLAGGLAIRDAARPVASGPSNRV